MVHEVVATSKALTRMCSERATISATTRSKTGSGSKVVVTRPLSALCVQKADDDFQRRQETVEVWGVGLQVKLPSLCQASSSLG